ncbi:MAG: GGDEF domain-containing protein, partial [Pseudomonas sp.]
DISDLKRVEEELRALSVTDSLTGIHNRRYFQERLKAELERAQRDQVDLAVIMLDIDHFKRINDQFGHAMGDRVLQNLCQRISQRLRRTDVFCRLGGEEFMVLCPGSNAEQAHALASELWHGLRSVPVEGVGIVTASFGIAGWRPGEGADALLLRADSGVYAAKQGGRDRVESELE